MSDAKNQHALKYTRTAGERSKHGKRPKFAGYLKRMRNKRSCGAENLPGVECGPGRVELEGSDPVKTSLAAVTATTHRQRNGNLDDHDNKAAAVIAPASDLAISGSQTRNASIVQSRENPAGDIEAARTRPSAQLASPSFLARREWHELAIRHQIVQASS